MCGPMLIASIMIQIVFSTQLLNYHKDDLQRLQEKICHVPASLQMCASAIFITLMFNEVPSVYRSMRIIFSATHHSGGDGELVGELGEGYDDVIEVVALKCSTPFRVALFPLTVATEVRSSSSLKSCIGNCLQLHVLLCCPLEVLAIVISRALRRSDNGKFETNRC